MAPLSLFPTPGAGGNRIRLRPKEYLLYGGAGLLLVGMIVLYVFEFDYFNRTFSVSRLLGVSAGLGVGAGAWLGYRFSKGMTDLTDRVQIYVFFIVLLTIFSPLLGSLSNRLLSFQPVREEPVLFMEQKAFAQKPYGVLQGEEVRPEGYYLFFLRGGKLERITISQPLPGSVQRGDTIYLPVRRGAWGVEWVGKEL